MLLRIGLICLVMFVTCVMMSGCSGGGEGKPPEVPVKKDRVPPQPGANR